MRLSRIHLAVTLCAAFVAVGPGHAAAPIAGAVPAIDKAMADFALDSHAPGLAYGIVANGRISHFKGLGVQDIEARRPVTADSLFRIASMTKQVTAIAILKLRDEGKLRLDDLAEQHVPEMKAWRYPTSDAPRIRIRDLLTHSAGFVTDNPWGDRQQPMSEVEFSRILAAGVPFSRVAGEAYEYSNFGYALLGRIITNVSGRPYKYYVEQEIFRPLGMNASGFEVSDSPQRQRALGYRWEDARWVPEPDMAHGTFGAMGGMQTSASDYGRYIAWLLSAWPARDGPESGPLKRSSIRELAEGSNFVRVAPRRGKTGGDCRLPSAYGYGLQVAQDCDLGLTLGHSGGYPGYGSYMLLLPEYGVGLFAFSNRTYNAPVGQLWDAAMALHDAGVLEPREVKVTPMLSASYQVVGSIYGSGDVGAASGQLANNFPMDRPAAAWQAELAALKQRVGACETNGPLTATGAMSGRFVWRCEHGRMRGELLLAPTTPATIQELRLAVIDP